MAPVISTEDYYALLEISPAADFPTIKSSYRRLALIKHPDKAKDKSRATEEFQLLQAAYSTLRDSELRKAYDSSYHLIQRPQWPHPNTTSETKRRGKSSTSTASDRAQNQEKQRRKDLRLKKLKELTARRKMYNNDLLEERRRAKVLRSELRVLRYQLAESERTRAEENGWTFFLTPITVSFLNMTEDEKAEASRRELDDSTAQRIKIRIIDNHLVKIRVLHENLVKVEAEISAVHEETLLENRKEMQARHKAAEQEAQRTWAEADRVFRAEAEGRWKKWEARSRDENRRQAAEVEQRWKELAEQQAEITRMWEDMYKTFKEAAAEWHRMMAKLQRQMEEIMAEIERQRANAHAHATTSQLSRKSVCDHRSY